MLLMYSTFSTHYHSTFSTRYHSTFCHFSYRYYFVLRAILLLFFLFSFPYKSFIIKIIIISPPMNQIIISIFNVYEFFRCMLCFTLFFLSHFPPSLWLAFCFEVVRLLYIVVYMLRSTCLYPCSF
jgi:hypothetical protein